MIALTMACYYHPCARLAARIARQEDGGVKDHFGGLCVCVNVWAFT